MGLINGKYKARLASPESAEAFAEIVVEFNNGKLPGAVRTPAEVKNRIKYFNKKLPDGEKISVTPKKKKFTKRELQALLAAHLNHIQKLSRGTSLKVTAEAWKKVVQEVNDVHHNSRDLEAVKKRY